MKSSEQAANLRQLFDELPNYDGRAHVYDIGDRLGMIAFCAAGYTHYTYRRVTPTVALALDLAIEAHPLRYGGVTYRMFGWRLFGMSWNRQLAILERHYGLDIRDVASIQMHDMNPGLPWSQWCMGMQFRIATLLNRAGVDVASSIDPEKSFYSDECENRPLTPEQLANIAHLRGGMVRYRLNKGSLAEIPITTLFERWSHQQSGRRANDVEIRRARVRNWREHYGFSNRQVQAIEHSQFENLDSLMPTIRVLDEIMAQGRGDEGPAAPSGAVSTQVLKAEHLVAQLMSDDWEGVETLREEETITR